LINNPYNKLAGLSVKHAGKVSGARLMMPSRCKEIKSSDFAEFKEHEIKADGRAL